jgi:predicted short-subunit dehydrogenase-like oxidoreductase (DUF2520 family)
MLSQWFLVGAGRCGLQLARALSASGLEVVGVETRSPAGRARARRALPGVATSPPGSPLPEGAALLIAVPDSAVEGCARALARRLRAPAPLALHTAGMLPAAALAPLAAKGCPIGSFHPLVSFPTATGPAVSVTGAVAAVEGDASAVREARRLARALGMIPVRLPPSAKPGYHAAAALAANMTHVLVAAARAEFVRAGFSPRGAATALGPLVLGSVEAALSARGLEHLTGPVARGDAAAVRAHLEALPNELATVYRAVASLALARLSREHLLSEGQGRKVASALTTQGMCVRFEMRP